MRLRVGLPAGRVHELTLGGDATVSDLEAEVVRAEGVPSETHRVRLVAAGKLLADPTARIDTLLQDGAFVHCAVSERPPPRPRRPRRPRAPVAQSPSAHRLPVLTAIDVDGEVRIVIPSLSARGFDRLGLSPEEVAAIRRQFRAARVRRGDLEPPASDADTDDEIDIELEEAWLSAALEEEDVDPDRDRDSDVAADPARHTAHGAGDARVVVANGMEGSNTDFLLGCMCGYLLSVLALALLLDKNISRRWRVGIVAGVATNCAFGVLRSSLYMERSGFAGR